MIGLKIFLVFLSCLFARGIWSRLFDFLFRKKISSTSFAKAFFLSVIQQIFQSNLDHAILLPWIQMRAGENSKRIWLLKLGLSAISGFFLLGMIWYWIYFLGLQGSFVELTHIQMRSDPPDWSLWLGDQSVSTLLIMSVFGVASALLFRRPFFGVAVAGVFLFAGIISIAGAVAILLGERLGLKILFRLKYTSDLLQNELNWSTIFSGFVVVANAFWGRALVEALGAIGLQNSFHPADRFILMTVTLLLWCLLDTFVSMAFYHFYWLKYQSNDIR